MLCPTVQGLPVARHGHFAGAVASSRPRVVLNGPGGRAIVGPIAGVYLSESWAYLTEGFGKPSYESVIRSE